MSLRRVGLMLAVWVVGAGGAEAHSVGVSRGEYRIAGGDVNVKWTFARSEWIGAIPALDRNRDGAVSGGELDAARGELERVLVRGTLVRRSAPCPGALDQAGLSERDGLVVRAVYHCGAAGTGVRFHLEFLEGLSLGHRHLATATAGPTSVRAVACAAQPAFEVAAGAEPERGTVGPLFRLGIQHIFTGYDHLVFLLGLILVGGRPRSLLAAVTAFTLAHSVSLGLVALEVWAPSPSVIEPAIALSIAYVGVENWFIRDASRRWLLTFPFGLVHGFGFAGALREISLPQAEVPLALVSFNLGVEAGQLVVLLVALPVVLWLRRQPWFAAGGIRAASAGIAAAGLLWFVGRVA